MFACCLLNQNKNTGVIAGKDVIGNADVAM